MNTLFYQINFAFLVAGLVVSSLNLVMTISYRTIEKWVRVFFIVFFSVLCAYLVSALITELVMSQYGAGWVPLSRIGLFSQSLCSSLLPLLFARFLLFVNGEDWRTNWPLRVMAVLWILYVLLLIVTQFTSAIYYFTNTNVYQRGPFYPVLLVPPALLMVCNLIIFFHGWKKLSARHRRTYLIFLLLPVVSMLIQMLFYGLQLIVFATSIAALILFTQILKEETELSLKQTEENLQQQMDIMVLQMRPHFIYNTMTSIYYLCETDSRKAQQVIYDFTTYLHKNFSAVAVQGLIAFEEELGHVKAYLAVEKARYDEYLYVGYDTPHTAFHLPPLTLQPIVENAVKHGVDPEMWPLHIIIRSFYAEQCSVISVEDTGPGYAPSQDSSTHIGIHNVRERLRLMCNGTLTISARDGGGTIVTIRIPDKTRE